MPAAPDPSSSRFTLGRWAIDLVLHEAKAGIETVALGSNEVALLRHLHEKGTPSTRKEVLVQAFGYAPAARSRAVDMVLRRLRKKLENDPSQPVLLCSRPRVGLSLGEADAPRAVGPATEWAELDSPSQTFLLNLALCGGVISATTLTGWLGPQALDLAVALTPTWVVRSPLGLALREELRALVRAKDADWEPLQAAYDRCLVEVAKIRRFESDANPAAGLSEFRELFRDLWSCLERVGRDQSADVAIALIRYLDAVGPVTTRDVMIREGLKHSPQDARLQAFSIIVLTYDERHLQAACSSDSAEVRLVGLEFMSEIWPEKIDITAESTLVASLKRPFDQLIARQCFLTARSAQGQDVTSAFHTLIAECSSHPIAGFWTAWTLVDHLRRDPAHYESAVQWTHWAAQEAKRHGLLALVLHAERKRASLLADIDPAMGMFALRRLVGVLEAEGWPTSAQRFIMAALSCSQGHWSEAHTRLLELRNEPLIARDATIVTLLTMLCEAHLDPDVASLLSELPESFEIPGMGAEQRRALIRLLHAEFASLHPSPAGAEVVERYLKDPGLSFLMPRLRHLAQAFIDRVTADQGLSSSNK